MCGIAGSFRPKGVSRDELRAMGDAIAHRGPDGDGYLLWAPGGRFSLDGPDGPSNGATVGFAHRRLAIIDLSDRNDQPALDASGRLAMVFNGEIYNYLELRDELEGLGHSFATTGDTEVLLSAYAQWGAGALDRLVGMWALAILDRERRELFLARDRFGIKPLYYAVCDGGFHFASEIKSLLALPSVRPEPDEGVARRYLISGASDEGARTFFEGIDSLPPAHTLTVSLDGAPTELRPRRYWSLPPEDGGRPPSEAVEEFGERLADSIRLHARSDVPVGTCLSGGLDSSAVVCVAEQLRAQGVIPSYAHHGFGYVPDADELSERPFMEEVAESTGLRMTYVTVSAERFASELARIARQQDEPFGSVSIAAQWFVFESASQAGMKVMLDGQGADEMLAGYHTYLPLIGRALLRSRERLGFGRFALAHRRTHGRWPLSRAEVRAEARRGGALEPAPAPPGTATVLSPQMAEALQPPEYSAPRFDSVHALLSAHLTSLGLPALLRFEDRNSMAHSIEARVPFLDHRLVEFVFRLPTRYKLDGVRTKAILRDALRGVLPERIRTRTDKIGFRAEPSVAWRFAEQNAAALTPNRTELEQRWLSPTAVSELLEGSDRSIAAEFQLWRVINFKLWLRSFWDDSPDAALA